ncbi:MAG: tryptophan synthase subunit alpha [Candidatus Eremiobacteraeota bacterium]|nr:tryptophan synthase subunit alpha [Candidatus Eremiobacteraeota bacterium]
MKFQTPTLIPYLTAGWPDEEGFLAAVRGVKKAGCELFEVGFPFSDPVADGPTVQKTSSQALARGVGLEESLTLTAKATSQTGLPAVVMTYANMVFFPGVEVFCRRIAEAGAQGLIVPDLPLEEAAELEKHCAAAGVELVQMCAPTTPPERARELGRHTRGFLYLVSVVGVTGARTELPTELEGLIQRVKAECQAPVCVGFGISTPAQAARVAGLADGVVVGSALLRHIESLDPGGIEAGVADFLGQMRQAMVTV